MANYSWKLSKRALSLAFIPLFFVLSPLQADSITGSLFVTTPELAPGSGAQTGTWFNLWSIDFNYIDTGNIATNSFSVGTPTGIAFLPGAGDVILAPDGNLLVAGQTTNLVQEVTTTGIVVNTAPAGTGSFGLRLASNANDAILYNFSNGADPAISALTLSGGGLSTGGQPLSISCDAAHPFCGTKVISITLDTATNAWYYGTALEGDVGDFGIITFSGSTATLHPLSVSMPDHDVRYDPFTGYIIGTSGNLIEALDPLSGQPPCCSNPILNAITGGLGNLITDGQGHYFATSNDGYLDFIDASQPNNGIGDSAHVFSSEVWLSVGNMDVPGLGGLGLLLKQPDTNSPRDPVDTPAAVPEPGSFWLCSAAITMLLICKIRPFKKRRSVL